MKLVNAPLKSPFSVKSAQAEVMHPMTGKHTAKPKPWKNRAKRNSQNPPAAANGQSAVESADIIPTRVKVFRHPNRLIDKLIKRTADNAPNAMIEKRCARCVGVK